MKNYQCKKCRTVVQGYFVPATGGCSLGVHDWIDMGSVKLLPVNNLYKCRKCGEMLEGESAPEKTGCLYSEHTWDKIVNLPPTSLGGGGNRG